MVLPFDDINVKKLLNRDHTGKGTALRMEGPNFKLADVIGAGKNRLRRYS